MPIYPLPVFDEEAEQKALDKLAPPSSIVVRYGYLRQIGEFHYNGNEIPGCGTKLVVRTPRGMEIGQMLTVTCSNGGCGHSITRKKMLEYIDNSGGKQYPFTDDGRVIRIATAEDLNEQSRLDLQKPLYLKTARAMVKEMDLDMKVIDVEPLLGADRIVFYFTSESRVDFRELVRQLAAECHSRIEMRQVGARDEARLVADYEKCGQHCCCRQFLKVLKPVSMRSAKLQKATLDPTKISGRCGRLMCCLRYEDQTYDQLRKNLPHRNSRVMTEDGLGTVVSTQILTQLALIELDKTGVRQAYPVEHIQKLDKHAEAAIRQQQEEQQQVDQARREEAKRDRPPKRREESSPRSRPEPRRPKPGQPLRDEEVESRESDESARLPDESPADDVTARNDKTEEPREGAKKKRRRRRRRGGKGRGPGGEGGNSGGGEGDGGGGNS